MVVNANQKPKIKVVLKRKFSVVSIINRVFNVISDNSHQ